jgi:glycosyltransferase involved in cell wall biosynthesis
MEGRVRVLDVVNTDHAALNFLAYRVAWINRHTEFRNDIVCTPGPHLARVHAGGGEVFAMPIPRGLGPLPLTGLLIRLVRLLRAERYTIVHTHNSVTGAVGRLAAWLARVPLTIHTTHGFHFHDHMSAARRLPFVAAERWLARRCDLLLFQNHEELQAAERLGLRPRRGVFHVGNGIDLRRFRPRTAPPENPRPIVLSVGRLEPVKNHVMLFDALQLLRERIGEAGVPILRLVGDGPSRARYEQLVARRGLGWAVEFLGYRYDIPQLNAAADVAVLTSVKEGIPRALMEAMAVGVPVVATDVKGSREVVVDGATGFLVPLGDAAALADRLALLLERPGLRQQLGRRGVQHARLTCDEERVVERLAGLYRSALHGPAPAEALEPVRVAAEGG